MPSPDDMRHKTTFELYSCPDFEVTGVLYPGNKLFLHLDWPSQYFTPSVYKKMLLALAQIRRGCREQGIPKLYVLVPESLVKWESLFGFGTIEEWEQKNPTQPHLFLMSQDT